MAQDSSRKQKKPRKATQKSLENAALYYLQRYASSAENLRRVLMRRVDRSARAHDTDPEEGAKLVDDLVQRYRDAKLVDDAAYATMRVASLRRRGGSARAIRANLMAKGVSNDDIDQALADDTEDTPMAELIAACAYARRRRLGPWREKDREERQERDLGALARKGFSIDTVRQVIDADSVDDLDERIALGPDG
jgi:regulatory protein